MDKDLAVALRHLSAVMDPLDGPWAIFGGAAMVLWGGEPGPPRDVDVLTTVGVAEHLQRALDTPNVAGSGSGRFRSQRLLRPALGPVMVEVMAGLQVKTAEGWRDVPIPATSAVESAGTSVHVARRAELVAMFEAMGRPKDLRRVRLLRA
ncbi:hypothetical protein JANAI62_12670 [Jannaschia pagri]|uniref:Uncharacterized protein n=1 Tax=Jannaschia pagri TaxID=2829797 RepID=A0ABQ4NJP0_9RHOB|nr:MULTISPECIES: hypothetical protein [unclassified Jannaschia]GIT90812.1 hypothetical protein JANAI61_12700 [Jannaschia sp. AI_61]GIT94644.1 hypothetical protein JANAI62_12670 [Jannaschia sp. AI_62]